MAVLIEAISVIIRRTTINDKYPGGWDDFVLTAPNNTLCADDKIARVGFMSPDDVKSFIKGLEKNGFIYLADGKAVDIAVIDQLKGFMVPCDWLSAGHVEINGQYKIAACKLKKCRSYHIALPEDWIYEQSLSREYAYVPSEHMDKSMKYLRHENGVDVYLNLLTDEEVYVGRADNIFKDTK